MVNTLAPLAAKGTLAVKNYTMSHTTVPVAVMSTSLSGGHVGHKHSAAVVVASARRPGTVSCGHKAVDDRTRVCKSPGPLTTVTIVSLATTLADPTALDLYMSSVVARQ